MKLWALLLCIHALFGSVMDHVLPVSNKSAAYSMPGIDFIYMINLDERPEKLKASLDQLSMFQIYPCRFAAVNGWKLSVEELDDIGLKYALGMYTGLWGTCYLPNTQFEPSHQIIQNPGQTYFCHCLSRGAIGCALSHLSILQDAYYCGYETIWVMEDDIDVISDPRSLPSIIAKLDALVGKEGWDILFTDRDIRDARGNYVPTYAGGYRPDLIGQKRNDFAKRVQVSPDFYEIGARSGTTSMILRRRGIQRLFSYFQTHSLFFPLDMEIVLPPDIKLYTVTEDIVSNSPRAASDNGEPNYLTKGPL